MSIIKILLKWTKSLFTTAGKINPFAIILLVGSVYHFSGEIREFFEKKELVREATVLQDKCVDQIEVINEARKEQNNADEAIRDNKFGEWLERVQRDD